jgi:hypothetical protein
MSPVGRAPILNDAIRGVLGDEVAMRRRTVIALSLAYSLASYALPYLGLAAVYDGKYLQLAGSESCVVGHRFEPGPIVEGHNRQPTQPEFSARMRKLHALTETDDESSGGRACSPISAFPSANG